MKILKAFFLNNRFFYFFGGVLLTFLLGYTWGWFIWLGWLLLGALVIATLVDGIRLFRLHPQVTALRKVGKHFSMNDENEVLIQVFNEGGSAIQCRLIDELPYQFQEREFGYRFTLPAEAEHKISYQLKPLSRGEYVFEDINLFLGGKLGLVEYRKVIPQHRMVKVYPSFVMMKKFELMVFNADRMQAGVRKIRRIGHGYEFSDIRQYVLGDDPRSLNWKASSRTGTLMVNNYQDEKSQQIYALINKSRVMRMPFNGLSLMDYAINTTLSILNIVLRNQDNAGLLTFSTSTTDFIPAQRRSNQLQLVLDRLYNQEETTEEANYQDLYRSLRRRIKGRSLLLMFTNFMSIDSLQRALPELKRINRGHLLVVIFFQNTELEEFRKQEVKSTLDISAKTMADKLSEESTQVVYELRNAGIQAIQTRPEELTATTVNKYLELKSRGMI